MKKSTTGAIVIVLLGAAFVGVWYFVKPLLEKHERLQASDARPTTTLRIGGDGYLGYWFLQSPLLQKEAAKLGITIDFTDDQGAYAERLAKFAQGEYELIVLPINSYVQHGAARRYPGVIVGAICESRGADGIVGFSDRFPTGVLTELNDPKLRVVYTRDSPSEFLLDLTVFGFEDVSRLASATQWRVPVDSPAEVLKRARARAGDAFVLWEPELSQATNEIPGLRPLWGSDRFRGHIIDVFVVHAAFLRAHEEAVLNLLEAYFHVLDVYVSDRERMLGDMRTTTSLKREVLETMLPKIEWFDLRENCNDQFGLSSQVGMPAKEGVVNCILQSTSVLVRAKKLERNPLEDPYLIVKSTLLDTLVRHAPAQLAAGRNTVIDFAPLTDEQWRRLRKVAAMKEVAPITFQTGEEGLDGAGAAVVDAMAKALVYNFPSDRVLVRGHTGAGSDEDANVRLSLERARCVVQRLIAVHGLDSDRLRAEGVGSQEPPSRIEGESERSFRYRLPRVEFVLLREEGL
jgi:outer membrane protein OmpA-like peptidoglycan-associated protein